MAADATQPDLARGKLLATQVCGQCHGADGNSATAAFPRLASQHQEYLVKQLNDFKVPRGDRVSTRNNPIMAGITASLSEQDARNVAAYLALQPARPGVAPNAADVTLGEKIYRMGIADRGIPACTGCHGPNGQGMATQYPRLSGQWADYVAAQLKAFQQPDRRRNNEQMQQIASRLSDEEIKAVAHYIAGLH